MAPNPLVSSVEIPRSPKFLGGPQCAHALLSDPAGTIITGHCVITVAAFRCTDHVGSGSTAFRGSITRLMHSLCTLRSARHHAPRNTRFWLVANLCQTGLVTCRVHTRRFPDCRSLRPFFSPSPSLLGATVRADRQALQRRWQRRDSLIPMIQTLKYYCFSHNEQRVRTSDKRMI